MSKEQVKVGIFKIEYRWKYSKVWDFENNCEKTLTSLLESYKPKGNWPIQFRITLDNVILPSQHKETENDKLREWKTPYVIDPWRLITWALEIHHGDTSGGEIEEADPKVFKVNPHSDTYVKVSFCDRTPNKENFYTPYFTRLVKKDEVIFEMLETYNGILWDLMNKNETKLLEQCLDYEELYDIFQFYSDMFENAKIEIFPIDSKNETVDLKIYKELKEKVKHATSEEEKVLLANEYVRQLPDHSIAQLTGIKRITSYEGISEIGKAMLKYLKQHNKDSPI